ncbi:hypothetical protein ACEUDR_02055 [Aeromonas veronii]
MPSKYLSNGILRDLLSKATNEELLFLTKIINHEIKKPMTPQKLQNEICLCGGHGVANFFRGQGTSYLDMIDDVINELDIKGFPSYYSNSNKEPALHLIDDINSIKINLDDAVAKNIKYTKAAEEKIILKLLDESYKRMSPEERLNFDNQINDVAKKFGSDPTKKLAGTAGLIALGNLGGFATYTFLTTSLSAISMGTLGFGAYTAATSALSILLGPIGWTGLGLAAVYSYGKPKLNKTIPLIAAIGTIRQRIEYDESNINSSS